MVHLSGGFPEPDTSIWQKCLNGLLSPCCVLCGLPSASVCLCYSCKMDLPWIDAHCRQCGVPLETETVESCGQCCQTPPAYWSVVSPLIYEFPVNRLVQALKFRRQLAEGRVLSHLLAEYIYHQEVDLPDVLIPVPLHRWRMLKRGFNQAYELAAYISRALGVRLDGTSLRRSRYTIAQSGLSRKQRLQNVHGAFQWHADQRACKHIAVVDDVMTTGTTATECARVLMNAGAQRVDIWVAARAAPPGKPATQEGPDTQATPATQEISATQEGPDT